MLAELVLVPVGEAGAVDPDSADRGLERADQNLAERRLARPAWADHAEDLARVGAEAHPDEDRAAIAPAQPDFLDLQYALGRGQCGVDPLLVEILEVARQPARGGASGGERRPGTDDAFDRLQRAAQEHGGSD